MQKPKILILFYSMYGHIYELLKNVSEGIIEAGGEPVIKIVEDLIPYDNLDENAKKFKDSIRNIAIADPAKDLKDIDGIIIGTPTRFGNMTAQLKYFFDQTVDDWFKGSLIGKPVSFVTSSATQHGGQETTIISSMIPLLHHGCVIVGLPYSFADQMRVDEITGGSPYGVSTVAGGRGERMPSENEKKLAKSLGKHHTEIAKKLMSN